MSAKQSPVDRVLAQWKATDEELRLMVMDDMNRRAELDAKRARDLRQASGVGASIAHQASAKARAARVAAKLLELLAAVEPPT